MSKKAFFIILVLSVVVTVVLAYFDFIYSITKGAVGLPLGFSTFNFFGAETNYASLLADIIFWFVLIFGIWKVFTQLFKK